MTPDITANTNAIRGNIQYLHKRLLNQDLSLDDPEIDATAQLFSAAFGQLRSVGDTTLPQNCQSGSVNADPHYTARAWAAVLTYLLADYDYIFQGG